MGRLQDAIEAGRKAVAQHEAMSQALLAIGLDASSLLNVAQAHVATASPQRARVMLIADRLPAELVSEAGLVYEHLPQMADLLVGAAPAEANGHRLRRLSLILKRWNLTECLWIGGESEELVQLAKAMTEPDRLNVAFHPYVAGVSKARKNR